MLDPVFFTACQRSEQAGFLAPQQLDLRTAIFHDRHENIGSAIFFCDLYFSQFGDLADPLFYSLALPFGQTGHGRTNGLRETGILPVVPATSGNPEMIGYQILKFGEFLFLTGDHNFLVLRRGSWRFLRGFCRACRCNNRCCKKHRQFNISGFN
ncbi:hypothetical protein HUO14_04205 [Parasphingorhabdus flavimaris]|uniref:Uncharacterized protein n=1 Tax=Parasphingorhabdus flavimaris TaxID=266812 RepID=A0ABX2N080_9SPHN|nr:hypothetical protein [Parasphingorhabdus flavimaris]NVD27112.1 hypothetical protein [Parasphingorhabdus flavimaris]